MFRRWKVARAKDGANTPRRAPDRTVRTAEGFVRRAWALELARWRDRQEFALRIERENCENAIGHLLAALRDGDPEQISVARTVALEASDAVRAAVVARDLARRAMHRELRVPAFIGAVAAGQRHYFDSATANCAKSSTVVVTIIAGPLNYIGVNPKVSCPTPSK
jgi:hypothetical protein